MVFSSVTFLFCFLPAVIFFYWLPDFCFTVKSFFGQETATAIDNKSLCSKYRRYKNIVLLIFSLIFYAWGEPTYVLIMILSIVCNYGFGMLIDKYRNHDKALIRLSLIFNLGLLFIFKYLCFTLQNIGYLINKDFSDIKIVLPLGISFFTFQAMSYVIDVYKKKIAVQKSLLNLGLYISLFPQLIAGPIVRYETIANEIENREENYDDFSEGIIRFIQGLAKKVIISNNIVYIAISAFEMPIEDITPAFAWLGVLGYALQVYFDFSGYSDMAIGLGRMFGFHFLENFNYPYIATTITDFWRRWHISMGTWFRDYVYFSLGGSRVSKGRHIFNLFAVWFLTGFWHGANWTFIAWGLYFFLLLILEKQLDLTNKKTWWGHIYTLFFLLISMAIIRADNITYAFGYICKMLSVSTLFPLSDQFIFYLTEYKYVIAVGILFSLKLPIHLTLQNQQQWKNYCTVAVTTILFLLCTIFLVQDTYNPFIYFNF